MNRFGGTSSVTATTMALVASTSFVAGTLFASMMWGEGLGKGRRRSPAHDDDVDDVFPPCEEGVGEVEVMDAPGLEHRMIRKAETVLQKRTSWLLVVIERCTDDHNYSAILRTAEALGVQNVWLVDPPTSLDSLENGNEGENEKVDETNSDNVNDNDRDPFGPKKPTNKAREDYRIRHNDYARNAAEWLTLREFETTTECLEALRTEGYEVWATDLGQEASRLTRQGVLSGGTKEQIIPPRLAVVFGTEAVGCSAAMLQAADRRVYLPLHGFADSLNLSVAAALCLLRIQDLFPRHAVGRMDETLRQTLRTEWYVKMAIQRITTPSQKKNRAKLVVQLKKAEEIHRKFSTNKVLTPEQTLKLEGLPALRHRLDELDRDLRRKALRAVQPLLDDPPPPFTDMRRADVHRVCFVGKNTKRKHAEHWAGMPATAKVPSSAYSSATGFRAYAPFSPDGDDNKEGDENHNGNEHTVALLSEDPKATSAVVG